MSKEFYYINYVDEYTSASIIYIQYDFIVYCFTMQHTIHPRHPPPLPPILLLTTPISLFTLIIRMKLLLFFEKKGLTFIHMNFFTN